MAELVRTFRLLGAEQKAAAIGAVLLAISTFGPFSFVEAAELLVAFGVLALLRARALGKRFHLPFGDGTVIATAGIWAAALIVVRLFDRPLGQNMLALGCAAILIAAGARERAKRPADDIPAEHATPPIRHAGEGEPAPAATPARERAPRSEQQTAVMEDTTEPLPPPEFKPYRPQEGEQLRLGREQADEERQPPGEG